MIMERINQAVGLVWKLITIPISIISLSLGVISGAIGLGFWLAGGVLSFSLSLLGLTSSGRSGESLPPPGPATAKAMNFVAKFESQYGRKRPDFEAEGFTEALRRSRSEGKLLFVYLHSPENPDTAAFCKGTLCSEIVSAFVNVNFVVWGESVGANEGFTLSKSFQASKFPFCAVVKSANDQTISLLQKFEGPSTPEEMLTTLQRVLEDNSPDTAYQAKLDAEEHRNITRLKEEQDAAYRAPLETDQARERQAREEQELEREAAEAERTPKEEKEADETATREADEKEAALVKPREEKPLSLGPEPEKGPDVTQVLVRLPNGERRGRRFDSNDTLQSLYDFVDSSGCLDVGSYTLVTFFPRVLYGQGKLSSTLKELGLHPQASLFVELNS